jgi:hypothetical protein
MSTLQDAADFATDQRVIGPLTAALVAAAVSVMNEAADTDEHAARVALAFQVLQSPSLLVPRFAWALSANATIVGQWASGERVSAENDFAFGVASVWNAEAGISL